MPQIGERADDIVTHGELQGLIDQTPDPVGLALGYQREQQDSVEVGDLGDLGRRRHAVLGDPRRAVQLTGAGEGEGEGGVDPGRRAHGTRGQGLEELGRDGRCAGEFALRPAHRGDRGFVTPRGDPVMRHGLRVVPGAGMTGDRIMQHRAQHRIEVPVGDVGTQVVGEPHGSRIVDGDDPRVDRRLRRPDERGGRNGVDRGQLG